MNIAQLIEDLSIANTKLYNVCNKKADAAANPDKYSKEELLSIMEKDIALCKQRGELKNQINQFFNQSQFEVKSYGS